tara:strand:- start:38 stop:1336 length:1299 start_codon:yes stop_codon:yes gene_type:complete
MAKIITDYVRPSFADDVIAALGNPKRGVYAYEDFRAQGVPNHAYGSDRDGIRQARRFEVEDEIVELAYQRSIAGWETTVADLQRAMAPFNLMWVEWDEAARQKFIAKHCPGVRIYEDADETEKIGYLIQQLNTETPQLDFHLFWKEVDSPKIVVNTAGFTVSPLTPLPLIKHKDKEFHRAYKIVSRNFHIFRYPEKGSLEQFSYEHNLSIDTISKVINAINAKMLLMGGIEWGMSIPEHPWSEARLISAMRKGDNPEDLIHPSLQFKRDAPHLYGSDADWQSAFWVFDRVDVVEKIKSTRLLPKKPNGEEYEDSITMAGDVRFLISLLAMINYDWVAPLPTPLRSSQKSIAYGKRKPHSVYYRLGLTLPKEQIQLRCKEPRQSSPKREHEVRGHWRRYQNGKVVWIKSHRRGNASLGIITKDYVLLKQSNQT